MHIKTLVAAQELMREAMMATAITNTAFNVEFNGRTGRISVIATDKATGEFAVFDHVVLIDTSHRDAEQQLNVTAASIHNAPHRAAKRGGMQ